MGDSSDGNNDAMVRAHRPAAGGRRRAYDSATTSTRPALDLAVKVTSAQLADMEAAREAYERAFVAYREHMDTPAPKGRGAAKAHREETERLAAIWEVERKRSLDLRRQQSSGLAAAALLVKAGKVTHDADLDTHVERMSVTGIDKAAAALFGGAVPNTSGDLPH